MATRRTRNGRPRRPLRWLGVGALCLVAFLYSRPARTYFETRSNLSAREAEVRQLQQQKAKLRRLLAASTSDAALAREARRLGLVRPGERLFIVKGIAKWQREHGYAREHG